MKYLIITSNSGAFNKKIGITFSGSTGKNDPNSKRLQYGKLVGKYTTELKATNSKALAISPTHACARHQGRLDMMQLNEASHHANPKRNVPSKGRQSQTNQIIVIAFSVTFSSRLLLLDQAARQPRQAMQRRLINPCHATMPPWF